MRFFKTKKLLTPFQLAVKRGCLINMQEKPYAEFNRALKVSCPIGMTRAAFKEFVMIPHEKGHLRIQKAARWAVVLADLHNAPREGDPMELVYDVHIHRLSGFHQYKPIKVVTARIGEETGMLFMLPDEEPPIPV